MYTYRVSKIMKYVIFYGENVYFHLKYYRSKRDYKRLKDTKKSTLDLY